MSKAYREWKEKREWGLLHRWPTPKRMFRSHTYRSFRRAKQRHDNAVTKSARDIMSQATKREIADWIGADIHELYKRKRGRR